MYELPDHLRFLTKIQVLYEALEDSNTAQIQEEDWAFFLKGPLKEYKKK
jgi:hypothetical protein